MIQIWGLQSLGSLLETEPGVNPKIERGALVGMSEGSGEQAWLARGSLSPTHLSLAVPWVSYLQPL